MTLGLGHLGSIGNDSCAMAYAAFGWLTLAFSRILRSRSVAATSLRRGNEQSDGWSRC